MRWIGKNIYVVSVCAVFIALYLVVLAQLLGRVLGVSILFAEDASSILFIWFVMGGAVVAYQLREHLEVSLLHDFLAPKFPFVVQRGWLLLIASAQVLFLAVFSWGLAAMTQKTWAASFGALTGFRFGYLYLGVLACSVCALCFVVSGFFGDMRAAKRPKD